MKTFKSLQEAREWRNPDIIKYEVVPVTSTLKSIHGEEVKYFVRLRDERFATKAWGDFPGELTLEEIADDSTPSSREGAKAAEEGKSEEDNPYDSTGNSGGGHDWLRGHRSVTKKGVDDEEAESDLDAAVREYDGDEEALEEDLDSIAGNLSKKSFYPKANQVRQVKPAEGISSATDDTAPIDDSTVAMRVMTKQNIKDSEGRDGMTGAGNFEVDQEDTKLKAVVTNFIKSWDDSDADDYRDFPKPRTYRKESGYYAPGTENDPDAPWNEVEEDDDDDGTEKSAARLTDYDGSDEAEPDAEHDEDMARLERQVKREYDRRDNQDARWYEKQAEAEKSGTRKSGPLDEWPDERTPTHESTEEDDYEEDYLADSPEESGWFDGDVMLSVQEILKKYLKGDATKKELGAVQGTDKPEKLDDKASSKAVKERAKKVDNAPKTAPKKADKK